MKRSLGSMHVHLKIERKSERKKEIERRERRERKKREILVS